MKNASEQINVRHANNDDLGSILKLIEESRKEIDSGLEWSENEIKEALEDHSQRIIAIAKDCQTAIGFAAAEVGGKIYGWKNKDKLYFAFNYLSPQYRGSGVADKLSFAIIDYARSLDLKKIVSEPLTIAGRIHAEKTGFKLVKSEDYFGEKPSKIIRGEDGINVFVYYNICEIPLQVPDYLAVMDL